MMLQADDCQLVLVDFQARLMPAIHEGPAVLANARRLAQMARWLQVPVWATEQVPAKLGATDEALAALCERIVAKTAFSGAAALQALLAPPAPAARGNARSLPKHLQKPAPAAPERGTLVLAGCEAHVCLLQTALGLLRGGRRVWVVASACGSRRSADHALAMQRLRQAGATVVSSEMVLFEWLGDCRHPQFKQVLQLVKDAPLEG